MAKGSRARSPVLAGAAGHIRGVAVGTVIGIGQLIFGRNFPGWFDSAGSLGVLVAATSLLTLITVSIAARLSEMGRLTDMMGSVSGGIALIGGVVAGFLPGLIAPQSDITSRIAAWLLLTAAGACLAAILLEKRPITR